MREGITMVGGMRVVLLASLLVVACAREPLRTQPAAAPPLARTPRPPAPAAPTPLPRFTRGQALYIRYCSDCHGWEGRGNPATEIWLDTTVPTLARAELFSRYTEDELVARVLLGTDLRVGVAGEAVPDNEVDVAALLTHLRRLPRMDWNEVQQGRDHYDTLCVACHGLYGRGDGTLASALPVPPRDLSLPTYQRSVTDDNLRTIVAQGKGSMAGAGDVLTREQIRAVVAFLRVLSPGYQRYDRYCAVCHGPDGQPIGIDPQDTFGYTIVLEGLPTFDQEYFQTRTDDDLKPWVRHMVQAHVAVMPHFAGELDSAQARAIVRYLRALHAGDGPSAMTVPASSVEGPSSPG